MEDLDELVIIVAKRVQQNSDIDTLGKQLEFTPEDVQRYIATNHKTQNITWDGTLQMLRDWRKGQEIANERDNLKTALKKAGQLRLADELFPSSCSVYQPVTDVTGEQRNVKMSSSRPNTTKGYDQKQRELDEMRKKLKEKRDILEQTKQRHKKFESEINAVSMSSSKHLQTIIGSIKETLGDTLLKFDVEEHMKLISEINEEADKKIQIINERRQKEIGYHEVEIERKRKIFKDKQTKLRLCLSEIDEISKIVSEKISDLTSKIQRAIKDIELITPINQHDETLVNEAPQVLASIDENLSLNVHQDVSDCLDRIESEVERVKFVEGEVGGEYYGRIDGYIGKWELVKSIHIQSVVVNYPWVHDLVSEDEICVKDGNKKDTYVTNINTQHTEKVNDGGACITSCAPIDSNVIICNKRGGDFTVDRLDGCITLYDRQWNVIRDINIPRNGGSNSVYVDVDRDGMIIAAQLLQYNIYVINPANDKIVNTITMQGKQVSGNIQALSSGDIVVKTGIKYTVISRSGEEKAVIQCDEWLTPECRVDKLSDTLYIAYKDRARNTYAVDQVSRGGIIQKRRIVEYVQSDHFYDMSPCLVTPSGNLIECDGDKVLLYQKTFIL